MTAYFAKIRIFGVLLLGWALLAACTQQTGTVTFESYDKLKLGMQYESVVEIMGPPDHIQPIIGIKQYTWVNGERHIHAKFIAGRAIYYSSKGLQAPAGHPTPKTASIL